jgi:indole-3-glycerol phosphate synthase
VNALTGMAAHAARRVERLKREESVEALRGRPLYARVARSLVPALAPGARVVEIRFADPEGGLLVPREKATAAEAARLAAEAERGGAAAVAVWAERNFHAGDYAHLDAVRAACPVLLLIARDVVLDPWQLERCRAAGADGIELIPEVLGAALDATAEAARALGLTPVVLGPGLTVRAL